MSTTLRSSKFRVFLVRALSTTVFGAGLAGAQYPVQQDGRLFDANPQIGGAGRTNLERPAAPPLLGNAVAEGTAGRGLSLRTGIGITEQNTFRGGLPSGGLANFRRDSVSVADVASPLGGLAARTYYDPSNTVGTLGFLRGGAGGNVQNFAPGSGYAQGSAAALDQRLDLRVPNTGLTTGITGAAPGPAPGASFGDLSNDPLSRLNNYTSRNSMMSLYERSSISNLAGYGLRSTGVTPSIQASEDITGLLNTTPALPQTLQRNYGAAPGAPGSVEYANDPRYAAAQRSRGPLGSPNALWRTERRIDATLDSRVEQIAAPYEQQAAIAKQVEQQRGKPQLDANFDAGRTPAAQANNAQGLAAPAAPQTVQPPRVARSDGFANRVLPGNDLYTDMQISTALQRDPSPQWFEEMRNAARTDPALAQAYQERAQHDADNFQRLMRAQRIRTFATGAPSQLNKELFEAELAVREKRYFDAVAHYDFAYSLDPSSPLPLLGRGHAQLAAGEFMSAANSLILGLDRFTDIVNFNLDLASLMGGGELVDIRRSELMERLAQNEDAALRFLLGYLEYFGGRRGSAMANFEKAAQIDRSGSIITRMPSILQSAAPAPSPEPAPVSPGAAAPPTGARRNVRGEVPDTRTESVIPRLPSYGIDRRVPTRFKPRWEKSDAAEPGAAPSGAAAPASDAAATIGNAPVDAPRPVRRPNGPLDIPRPAPVQVAPK